MADITKAITIHLNSITAIDDLVNKRITPDTKPQNSEFPAISIFAASGDSVQDLDGGSGIANDTIQIDCWSESRTEANDLAELIRAELVGFRGTMGGIFVEGVTITSKVDDTEDPVEGSNNYVYKRIFDYDFWYSEATANK